MIPLDKIQYNGDVNIGFYGFVTDKFAILPPDSKFDFGVKKISLTVAGTPLIGLFLAGNSNGVIVPDILSGRELEILKKSKIKHIILKSKDTCLGNLLTVNDSGGIISRNLMVYKEEIEKFLKIELIEGRIADLDIVGSCCVATNIGFLAHRDVSEEEIENIKKALRVEGSLGSINFGSPYVKSGILANSQKVLIGNKTSGPEITRIQESLCTEE